MAKSSLFEYALLHHPKVKKDGQGDEIQGKDVILLDPKTVLAASSEQVGILAAREIPAEYLDKLDEVEIIVRPF